MLSKSERTKAAGILIEAERTKKQGKQLSVTFPKIDIDDAYAIQQEVTKRKLKAGRKVIGHKIGLTSKAMQQSLGINEPDYGHLFDDMLVPDGAKLPFGNYCVPRIEVEHVTTPSPFTPGGMKGMGEGSTNAAYACVPNAVAAALPDAAERLTATPLLPSRVWEAIHAAGDEVTAEPGGTR